MNSPSHCLIAKFCFVVFWKEISFLSLYLAIVNLAFKRQKVLKVTSLNHETDLDRFFLDLQNKQPGTW